MSDLSRIGRHELEAELHKWRTGHQLGAMQEDLNAMQARAVEAEATIERVSGLISHWRQHIWSEDRHACALELEAALKGKPCE